MAEEDPEVGRLLQLARQLEGMNRSVGTHAAGVVIADRPLEELVPLQKIASKDKGKEVITTQWEMGDIEKAGLLKMDFLGLRNLTTLDTAVRMINERHPDAPIDLDHLPLADAKTFELFQRGETKGLFQLESAGIRDLLIKMKPDRFADIVATNALYRPGPLNGGMVDEYVNVKNGRKQASYLHPVLKDILEETYGVMVYQEQVMRILNRLGGIELSTAYATIKAISKKKADVIAQSRDEFLQGAAASGLDREKSTKIFDLIEFFGGYGFNKSHSAAYALVVYQTAYLKAHYPTEFMAAVLSSEMDGAERDKFFVEHIEDCRRMGIEVLPPNINQGHLEFRVATEGKIYFGLGAIKGVGFKAVEMIVKAREGKGPFLSLDDFFDRVSTRDVGAGCVETLIHAGAFDCLGAKRSQLLAVLPRATPGRAVQAGRPPPRPVGTFRPDRKGGGFHEQRQRSRRATLHPARSPRAIRGGEARLREEGTGILYVESSPGSPRCSPPGAGVPSGRRPGRRGQQDRSRSGRDDHKRPDQKRPEEPVGTDSNVQAHLRGPKRHDLRNALARGICQDGPAGQERIDRLDQRRHRPAARPRGSRHQQDHPARTRPR